GGGGVVVFCKGADNVILERQDPEKNPPSMVDKIKEDVLEFTNDGLRTLLLAKTELAEADYQQWLRDFREAETCMVDREAKVEKVIDRIEEGLEIQGVTAIEDKLQAGVPDTLYSLKSSGIKVWMLTGDKVDTAINIGYMCSLITMSMLTLRLCVEETRGEAESGEGGGDGGKGGSEGAGGCKECCRLVVDGTGTALEEPLRQLIGELTVQAQKAASEDRGSALVVDTYALAGVLLHSLEAQFATLCSLCASVVCARVSPRQKSQVVEIVRRSQPAAVTLSIGDGANDVPMLQAAHIGVGIHGLEGAQAVNNSDYSFGQFCFLKRLLLVHGRWCYRRICKVILYMFYKNVLLVLPQFFFGFLSLFSGQNFYYDLMYQSYNVFFTGLPIITFGDVSANVALKYPTLYKDGMEGRILTRGVFWRWMGEGIAHAAIATFLPMGALGDGDVLPGGLSVGLWGYGLVVNLCVVLVAHGRLAMETKLWTWFVAGMFALSMAAFVLFWALFSEV
ncbi:unnamed protein product, partial [Discosporangium mesarthrocarpum]